MNHYLVTGGAGFIGSHITRTLLRQGAAVRVLDNFSTGRRENLRASKEEATSGSIDVIEADLRDQSQVAGAVRGIDVVFHEAAFVSVPESMERPQECLDVNVAGSLNLMEAARKAGVKRVVIASSAAVYGDLTDLPLAEETPPRPLSPYAVSKQVDELYAGLYTRSFGLEVTALRYFNVYGPRQNPNSVYAAAVPIFIRRLLDGQAITVFGDGGQTRDLIYVGDVVRANLLAAEHPAAAGQVFNICTGNATSILELVEALRGLFPGARPPAFGPVRAGDIYASVGRPTKAESLLGFRAEMVLADGLKATVEWMR
jgi:nucleoside-diphosphate-sugar epimerase